MKRYIEMLAGFAALITVALAVEALAESTSAPEPVLATPSPGYRDWKLISVAHEAGDLNDLRAILGNDIAVQAFRDGVQPFPDGAIIARLAWRYTLSEENNKVFGREQSFVSGSPVNGLQFMIKDSTKFASTGGWGYVQFDDGKPSGEAVAQKCYACHTAIESRDFVFTRYSP